MVKFRELTADERTRDMFERQEKARRDQAMFQRHAIKQSHMEIARTMMLGGEPVEKIVKYTGLTRVDIEGLQV